ncbi:MAG: phosphatase PAP2 family protein [Bdellovibrionales bacterium]
MKLVLYILLSFIFCASPVFADENSEPKLFDGLWENVGDSFSGYNVFYHVAGVVSTAALIDSGVDAHVYDTFRHTSNDAAWPGAILGSGLGALTAGLWLYSSDDRESLGAAFVIAQASLITVSYVSVLKAVTGRAHPTNTSHMDSQEQSEQFKYGIVERGVGYGWPSGHVSHTVAVTSALAHYYPHKTWLRWLSVGLSSYMLYTVSAFHAGQMHWFSDGVAGAFMGYSIGSTVGKNFRQRLDGSSAKMNDFLWLPVAGPQYWGLMAALQF